MSQSGEINNFHFIRKFYFYTGLFPKFDINFESHSFSYVKVTLIAVSLLTILVVKQVFDDIHDGNAAIRKYLLLSSTAINYLQIIVCIIKFSLVDVKSLETIFWLLKKIDATYQHWKQNVPRTSIKWILFVCAISDCLFCAEGVRVFSDFPIYFIMIGLIDQASKIYVGFIISLILYFLIAIKMRFVKLNTFLEKLASKEERLDCVTLDLVVALHNNLCNTCRVFQDIFGMSLLLIYVENMFFTLGTLSIALYAHFESLEKAIILYSLLTLNIVSISQQNATMI